MDLKTKIPFTDQTFYNATSSQANKNKVNNVIKPKYGSIVSNISKLTNVPEAVLYSFIFIESGGDETAHTPYAEGLLQLSPATASDALIYEQGKGRISDPEAAILKKYLGDRYDLIAAVKPNQKTIGKTFITNDDLKIPELNILIGAILIGQLSAEFTENNAVRYDKIAVVYNTGRFSKVGKQAMAQVGTTDELIDLMPAGQSDYIKKLVGKEGLLDSLV